MELLSRTGRFTYGAPRAITVHAGQVALFLRSNGPEDPVECLWATDLSTGEERLLADPAVLAPHCDDLPPEERMFRERVRLWAPGIGAYDSDGVHAVFTLGGRLFRTRLATGETEELPTGGPAFDPRIQGERIAYVVSGRLLLLDGDITRILAAESQVSWGVAEFAAAEELGRTRGHWWSPDGRTLLAARVDESAVPRRYLADPASPEQAPLRQPYPQAGGPNARVELHLLRLDGGRGQVLWDERRFPYVADAGWSGDRLVITVLDRLQQHGRLLEVNPATGTTAELWTFRHPQWIEHAPALDGGQILEVVESGEIQALAIDGRIATPPGLYVRRVAGRLGADFVLEAHESEPAEQHVYRLSPGDRLTRITDEPGVHGAVVSSATLVLTSGSLERMRTRRLAGDVELRDLSAAVPYRPRPVLERVTEHGLPAAVLYPAGHVAGERLPVLLDVYGGPGHQVIAREPGRWIRKQWWADQGFAVVTIDNRGTPNVGVSFGRAIFRRFSKVALEDQVAGLRELAGKHPDLDLSRVAVRGWSYGGYFAALAVLRRPDVFHAACAGAPPTDFRWYDTAYTERYLGLPEDNPEGYAADSLIADAPRLSRPLLLIHGLADDNVHPLHTLRLSEALTRAGRPHATVLLPGVSHMTPGGMTEHVMAIERDFLRRNLAAPGDRRVVEPPTT